MPLNSMFGQSENMSWRLLKQDEENEGEHLVNENDQGKDIQQQYLPTRSSKSSVTKMLPWIIHASLIMVYLASAARWYRKANSQCFDGTYMATFDGASWTDMIRSSA